MFQEVRLQQLKLRQRQRWTAVRVTEETRSFVELVPVVGISSDYEFVIGVFVEFSDFSSMIE